MSAMKTRFDIERVEGLLKEQFSADIKNLQVLKGGEISQAFSFVDESESYVIKVRKVRKRSRKFNPFEKEKTIMKILSKRNPTIPIPIVIKNGAFADIKGEKFIYSIVKKIEGEFVDTVPVEQATNVDSNLIDILHLIHTTDITDTKGYGNWWSWEQAKYKSMQDFIIEGLEREKIYTNERYSSGIFEIELYNMGSTKVKELIKFCPPNRYLVHADYGFDNVLTDSEGNITAVFDWEHSIFGDFVYDIAWIDFWCVREKGTYSNLYYNRFRESKSLDFENYDKRLLCYKIYMGISAAGFFSESNQEEKYLEAKKRILNLLDN